MTRLGQDKFREWILIFVALFAVVWATIRASVQSITIDEAFTYLYFASQPLKKVWEAGSNNHVLNSLLMWIITRAFGTSGITVRAPALLGAGFYVFICYFLCKNITNHFSLRLPLFICLTYNPFIFDFMVAARGYSLADAFLLAAIAVPVWNRVNDKTSLSTSCVLASLALGLSFSANFSFAFVDLAALLAIMAWAIRRRREESIMRTVTLLALPGLLAALVIAGYPLGHWQRGELWWGAHSLREMKLSLTQSSFYQLDPRFRGYRWYKIMDFLRPRLLRVLVALCIFRLAVIKLDGSWREDNRARWLGRCTVALAAIATLSVTLSWLAFYFFTLPLPLGRTGIFLVPLCTLISGAIAAVRARSWVSQWLGRGITAVLTCMACYFVLCLRLSYFREYQWDADIKDVYSVLARVNHTYGINDVGVNALYVTSLNYYRVLSQRETFAKFELEVPELTAGRSIYVLNGVERLGFIEKERLGIIYRGKFSDVVVAVQRTGPIPPTLLEP